jgi:hypothetical protein
MELLNMKPSELFGESEFKRHMGIAQVGDRVQIELKNGVAKGRCIEAHSEFRLGGIEFEPDTLSEVAGKRGWYALEDLTPIN